MNFKKFNGTKKSVWTGTIDLSINPNSSNKQTMYKRPVPRPHGNPATNSGQMSGRLAELLKPVHTTIWEYTYTPFKYLDSHVNSMKISGQYTQEEIDIVIAKNKSLTPSSSSSSTKKTLSPKPKINQYEPLVQGPDEIKVVTKVIKKDNKVKVKIINPYQFLLRHSRIGKPVPIESFVQFHKINGAPDQYLLDILEKHAEYMRKRKEYHAKLDSIFDKYTSSSSKKTQQQKKIISVVKKLPPVF